MQHTDKYNLNIIETTDAFGPEPLNENTRTLEAQLDAKAAQIDFADLSGRVGTLETDRLLWTYGSYTGSGEYGSITPTRIEFPFKPLMVLVVNPSDWTFGGFPWLYGQTFGRTYLPTTGISTNVTIKWSSRAVEFYTTAANTYGGHQMNLKGQVYRYFALGTEE